VNIGNVVRRAYAAARRLRLLWLVVGLAFFAAVIWFSGVSELDRIAHIDPVYVAGALLCTFGIAASSAARWGVLVDALAGGRSCGAERVAPMRQYYHYFIIGRAVSQVFPDTLSDVSVRSLALRLAHQYAIDAAVYSIAVDRVFDLATYLVYLVPAALFVVGAWPLEWAAGATAVIFAAGWLTFELWPGAAIGTAVRGYALLLRLAVRVPFLAGRLGNRDQMVQVPERHLSRGQARRLYFFNLVKLGFTFLRLWCFALALGLPIAPELLFFGMAIAQLSQAFAFTPGNLGTLELGWYAVLAVHGTLCVGGIDSSLIGAYLLMQRVLIAACVGLLGGVSYVIITVLSGERKAIG
jgi:uncharacterized membrane protein YbhN (UPF0104 family)